MKRERILSTQDRDLAMIDEHLVELSWDLVEASAEQHDTVLGHTDRWLDARLACKR